MKSNLRKINLHLLFFATLSLVICVLQVFAISIQPNSKERVQFIVENEIYTFSSVMKFKSITITSSYIVFDSIGFKVFSVHPIKISLMYLNSNIPGAHIGEKIVEFDTTTNHALVWFTLSGFTKGGSYYVNTDARIFLYRISKSFGYLSFLTIINGKQHFTIIKTYKIGDNKLPFIPKKCIKLLMPFLRVEFLQDL